MKISDYRFPKKQRENKKEKKYHRYTIIQMRFLIHSLINKNNLRIMRKYMN